MADYRSYVDCQEEVNRALQDGAQWTRMSILNTARMENSPPTEPSTSIWNLFKVIPRTIV
jgi:glycogen phosphorylase